MSYIALRSVIVVCCDNRRRVRTLGLVRRVRGRGPGVRCRHPQDWTMAVATQGRTDLCHVHVQCGDPPGSWRGACCGSGYRTSGQRPVRSSRSRCGCTVGGRAVSRCRLGHTAGAISSRGIRGRRSRCEPTTSLTECLLRYHAALRLSPAQSKATEGHFERHLHAAHQRSPQVSSDLTKISALVAHEVGDSLSVRYAVMNSVPIVPKNPHQMLMNCVART